MQRIEKRKPDDTLREQSAQYLTVLLAGQLYGFPVKNVVQIVEVPELVHIPAFPVYAKGVANLRGTIFPVVDLRLRLGLCEAPYTARTCVIITSIDTYTIGFVIDSVEEVLSLADSSMQAVMPLDGNVNRYVDGVCAVGNRLMLRFKMDTLLSASELDTLTSA